MILHLVNRSPFTHPAFNLCMSCLGEQDSVLLLEDGVFALAQPNISALIPINQTLYVLTSDLNARGIANPAPNIFQETDYQGFVKLVAKHDKTLSW